ncbi:MAG: ribbon-helix-helix protein, CopG family [Caulobacteraceae bacterium]
MTFSVRLPDALEARLDHLARATGRSKAYYVRASIEANLDEIEDLHMAEQATIRIRSGQERTWTQEEVTRDLGLDD